MNKLVFCASLVANDGDIECKGISEKPVMSACERFLAQAVTREPTGSTKPKKVQTCLAYFFIAHTNDIIQGYSCHNPTFSFHRGFQHNTALRNLPPRLECSSGLCEAP